jgi:hypothetical protein
VARIWLDKHGMLGSTDSYKMDCISDQLLCVFWLSSAGSVTILTVPYLAVPDGGGQDTRLKPKYIQY